PAWLGRRAVVDGREDGGFGKASVNGARRADHADPVWVHEHPRNGVSESVAMMSDKRLVGAIALSATLIAGCAPVDTAPAPILLFTGTGTSPGDVVAMETILRQRGFAYATASSKQLNAMSASKLREYKLLIVPGGNFIDIGTHLTPNATANVRAAVQGGVNYL